MTELPSYLEHVVEEAIDYYQTESDASISEAAVEIATSNNHLTSSLNENRDNLEVLQDLRDYTGICADELETYRNYSTSYDHGDQTIEAVVIRSLEELLHEELQDRVAAIA